MTVKPIVALILAAACLVSLAAAADPAKVRVAEEKAVIIFPDGTQGRTAVLKKTQTRFETPNAKIGEIQQGWLCGKTGDVFWNPKLYNLIAPGLQRTFRVELEKAHYPVPKVVDTLFEDAKAKPKTENELHVGMLIKDVAANFCIKGSDGTLGGVYMKVFWQVYAPDQQKVVFEATTEGSFQPEGLDKSTLNGFFEKALAVATRNFLAEQGFYDAVASTPQAEAKPAAAAPEALKLKGTRPGNDPLAKNVTMLRAAVVTVFGDVGSGSGFFVSNDGHLLTNYHVVGAARFVKVKLPTGRELVGEVLRSDKKRDVALVKTEAIGLPPIALRVSEPNVGEDVFALGSPLGEKFNTTLTKGILSGYRDLDDNRFLQSDVAILPGNSGGPLLDAKGAAVGITVAGSGAKGIAGINFFIPINDALSKLGLELY